MKIGDILYNSGVDEKKINPGAKVLVCGCYSQRSPDEVERIPDVDELEADLKAELDALADKVVYTGAIDAYFGYQLGALEYRSVRFETEVLDKPNFQGNAAVNYTDRETPWTRIIEHKWFEFGKDSEGNEIPEEDRKMTFEGSTVSTANQFEIKFTVYSNGASLTADAEWLKPTASSFDAGTHTVAIVVEENQELEERTANLILTSNGISTPITITQAKANNR